MRQAIKAVLVAAVLAGAGLPAVAGSPGRYEVKGVDEDDMLKLRAGPGVGYVVIVGLPNGAIVRVSSCQLIGGTSWCKVSLERARGLRGYVSETYLRKL